MNTAVFKDVHKPSLVCLWLLLAFQSGFMNAGGFLACHRFVSHVTGYSTHIGVSLHQQNFLLALDMAVAPTFFVLGAAYAGWLIDRRMLRNTEPKLGFGIATLAMLNLAIYLGGVLGIFGEFGEPLVLSRDFTLLFFLCFACGLQNGLFLGLTAGQIRTTHLTGPATDIGVNLSKIISLPRRHEERDRLTANTWLKLSILIAFSMGSMISAMVFSMVTYEGFGIPCLISVFLVWYVNLLMAPATDTGGRRWVPASFRVLVAMNKRLQVED
jgi:uncharacterized membrane protein YoaK (UPF0700 family)